MRLAAKSSLGSRILALVPRDTGKSETVVEPELPTAPALISAALGPQSSSSLSLDARTRLSKRILTPTRVPTKALHCISSRPISRTDDGRLPLWRYGSQRSVGPACEA